MFISITQCAQVNTIVEDKSVADPITSKTSPFFFNRMPRSYLIGLILLFS
jgi:hypothetical protein